MEKNRRNNNWCAIVFDEHHTEYFICQSESAAFRWLVQHVSYIHALSDWDVLPVSQAVQKYPDVFRD